MTRQELTHTRDLTMSSWIRKNLPDSKIGYLVSDLDFILFNYKTKKIMFLEVKTRGATIKIWQRDLFKNLNKWILKGISDDWIYLGFHLLCFEKTCFTDGRAYFDNKIISEDEFIKKLTF